MIKVFKNKQTGYYHMDLRIGGHRTRPSLKTKNRSEAIREAKDRLKNINIERAPNKARLYSFLDSYLRYSSQRSAKHTIECERSIVRVFKSLVEDQRVDQFTKLNADQFFALLDSRTKTVEDEEIPIVVTNRTKNYYIRHLKAMWNVARTWGIAASNPWAEMDRFPIVQEPVRTLTECEQTKILESTDALFPAMHDLIKFYLLTGLRRSEALRLEWSEIDLKNGVLTVLNAKGNKFRIVPLLKIPRDILLHRLPFVRPFVDMPCPDEVTHRFIQIVKRSGIQHAKLHDTRKTFGTSLARQNVNPYVIMKWLGHTNDAITMAHYIGFDAETARRIDDLGSAQSVPTINAKGALKQSEIV